MMTELTVLQEIRIASPCEASWEAMQGDERARFCGQCQKHVYNLSAMSAPDAAALVREKEGRLCVRYFARPDGTMLAEDCPVGFRAARRLFLARMATVAAACASVFGFHFRWLADLADASPAKPPPARGLPLMGAPPPPERAMMGKIAAPHHATMGEIMTPHPPSVGHMARPTPPPKMSMGDVIAGPPRPPAGHGKKQGKGLRRKKH